MASTAKSERRPATKDALALRYVSLSPKSASVRASDLVPATVLLRRADVKKLTGRAIVPELAEPADPQVDRFHQLIEKSYTHGLSLADKRELAQLEAAFEKEEAIFYEPIIRRLEAELERRKASQSASKRR